MKISTSILDRLLWPALLVLLAIAGYLLVTLPPMVVSHWRDVAADHPVFSTVYLGMVTAGGLLLLFVWGWMVYGVVWRLRTTRGKKSLPPPSKLSAAQQERETRKRMEAAARAVQRAEALPDEGEAAELGNEQARAAAPARRVRRQLEELQQKIERRKLEIVAFGAVSSGKSTLLNALLGEDRFATDPRGGTTLGAQEVPLPMGGGGRAQEEGRVILRDTPGLGEVLGGRRAGAAVEHAREADLVLFVVSGALRDFEFDALRALVMMEKRVLVCLNKEDWYTPEDFEAVQRQLREQIQNLPSPLPADDVIAVRARPSGQKRVRVMADGTTQEEVVSVPPDIGALEKRLREVIQRDGRDLLLANLLMRSRTLAAQAKAATKAGRTGR